MFDIELVLYGMMSLTAAYSVKLLFADGFRLRGII